MSTTEPDGAVHSVPVVFAVAGNEIVSPIDHKPKSGRVMHRVKNLERDGRVTLLIDHWDEQWKRLSWLMIRGAAVLDRDYPDELLRAVNGRYPQYDEGEHHDALIRITPKSFVWWSWE